MKKLQVIKHPQFGQLSLVMIDDREFFKAKEVATMLGYKNINDAIARHCKGVVKHDLPTKSGVQEVNLIPEGDVWRLIIRSKLPQAEAIEKWIMEEVLPTIRKTGKYEMHKPDQKPYEYFNKTYNGEPVLTAVDIEHLTGISRNNTDYQAKHNFNNGKDYFLLVKNELKKFKQENPKVNRLASSIMIITKNGFKKLCNIYGVKVEKPKCFEEKAVKAEIPKLLNEKQARELFEKECILMDNHDVILYERVAQLFGENVAKHTKDKACQSQSNGKYRTGIYYNCRGENCDIQYFTINGFFNAVTYSNLLNIQKSR